MQRQQQESSLELTVCIRRFIYGQNTHAAARHPEQYQQRREKHFETKQSSFIRLYIFEKNNIYKWVNQARLIRCLIYFLLTD